MTDEPDVTVDPADLEHRQTAVPTVEERLDRIEIAIRGLANWCPNYGAADYRAIDEILKGERE